MYGSEVGAIRIVHKRTNEVSLTLPKHMDLSLAIRGIAATLVVWWHSVGYKGEIVSFFNIPGRVSVWMFFIISGYVIAYGFVNGRYSFIVQGIAQFYKARLLRIFPLFWLVSIVSLISSFVVGKELAPISVAADFLALQWNHSYQLSGVFWTLGIEMQFYLIAPIVAWFLIQNKTDLRYAGLIFGAFLAWPVLAWFAFDVSIDNRTTLGNMSHFTAGMIVAISLSRIPIKKHLEWGLVGLGFCMIMLVSHLYHTNSKLFFAGAGALLVDLAGVFFLLAHCKLERQKRNPDNYLLSTVFSLGVLSYGLYAWHSYLMDYIPSLSENFIILFFSSLLLSYISYVVIERPALSLKNKNLIFSGV